MNKNKMLIATIAMALMLTMTAFITVMPAGAQEGREIPTILLISAQPDPTGLHQPIYVNAFMSKAPPTAAGPRGDRYEGITVTMVRPDGSTAEFGPYMTDTTGGTFFSIEPDQVGTYSFQAFYPGQILTGDSPGFPQPGGNLFMVGSQMLPSESEIVTVSVQPDEIEWKYHSPPHPDEYWTRPIYATNWNWGELGGSWYGMRAASFTNTGMYDAMGNFNPYTEAPNTPHILWTKPTQFGGLPGSPIDADQMSQYTSTSILIRHFEPIILNGIIYYTQHISTRSVNAWWNAVDMRTGEVLWTRTAGETGNERLRMGQILRFHGIQEYGSTAYLWSGPVGGVFRIYDAWSGEYLFNVTGAQNVPFLIDVGGNTQGSLLAYYTPGGNLTLWNSTRMYYPTADYSTWRPAWSAEWDNGIMWSVPRNFEINGVPTGNLGIGARTPEVILLRSAPQPARFVYLSEGYQITAGIDARTGELLWGPLNQTLPKDSEIGLLAARDGYYVLHDKDNNEAYGYSLETGELLWGPVALEGNAWSHISRGGEIAYGQVYIWDFGGYVNALDLQTGEIQWTFTRGSSGYDAPYGIYPLWHFGTHSLADGKLFLSEGSMYNPPIHPARRLAIDVFSGELVWSILSYSGRGPAAHADGMMVYWNSFDAQIYAIGKGSTKTTVEAPLTPISRGSSVIIRGNVMDISPGAEQDGVVQRFPNGLPAVADEHMSEWMEYVYMQQICPDEVDGVEVELAIRDPNGDYYVTTVTSDSSGMFSHRWDAPAFVGEYHVTAVFKGSESYWRSHATTSFAVDPAPAAPSYPDVPSADAIAQATVNRLPAYPQPPTADAIAQETINRLPAYPEVPEMQEMPAYLTIDLVILALVAVAVVVGLIVYMTVRKRK